MTALFVAVGKKYEMLIPILLEGGADLEVEYEGFTPLLFASCMGNVAVVTLLVNGGANIEAEINGENARTIAQRHGFHEIEQFFSRIEKIPLEITFNPSAVDDISDVSGLDSHHLR